MNMVFTAPWLSDSCTECRGPPFGCLIKTESRPSLELCFLCPSKTSFNVLQLLGSICWVYGLTIWVFTLEWPTSFEPIQHSLYMFFFCSHIELSLLGSGKSSSRTTESSKLYPAINCYYFIVWSHRNTEAFAANRKRTVKRVWLDTSELSYKFFAVPG